MVKMSTRPKYPATGLASAISPADVPSVSAVAALLLAARVEERVVRVEVLLASDAASSARFRWSGEESVCMVRVACHE